MFAVCRLHHKVKKSFLNEQKKREFNEFKEFREIKDNVITKFTNFSKFPNIFITFVKKMAYE